ncbi:MULTISPECIES: substrate-binding domain-containing protein [unclassified Methanoculleus]|uniref:substrate-binding domain-containing protein n=1 Tax=unclassified Methanoculleus TaxID=2619537 RepID=UPI0025CF8461|nr:MULTISPECIES: substrate-binding domain-containing protein [unclassified Methanoculleus]MCK9317602.1 substrate-binding domain-containing protein [Methanoculleus sp.]MDD2254109.1 substrate-binding domain-containing protein [Methanoculleus sp.]MDD2787306.1 substrate-binding domain-containing protein [Methanoculleus sp.]MDD3215878.1 substrate-binding domain-containing protein [Methanoculleus sp.]MDD4314213.1 substrate-binding domain-containing protein [Methanoculleus sp.]
MRTNATLPTAGIIAILLILALGAGCTGTAPGGNETPTATTTPAGGGNVLRIATTTSLENTGLLAELERVYENETGMDLQFIAQGTGQSIDSGRRGDVDLVLVHAPDLEQQFVDDGFGIDPRCIAYNYFIIVGPESDPAGIANMTPVEAFKTIYLAGTNNTPGVIFVSRGDNSGTHNQEKVLWEQAGYDYDTEILDTGGWYVEAGKGMGDTLILANEQQAYTLSDEGTYLSFADRLTLVPVIAEGAELLNRYSAIAVNPEEHPGVNAEGAAEFINWLTTNETKEMIGNFGAEEFGKPLFTPLYAPECAEPPFNCTCTGEVTG